MVGIPYNPDGDQFYVTYDGVVSSIGGDVSWIKFMNSTDLTDTPWWMGAAEIQPLPMIGCPSFDSQILRTFQSVMAPSVIPPATIPCSSTWSIQSSEANFVGL